MNVPRPSVTVPRSLAAICRTTPERAAWLARLPGLLSELQRRWSLRLGSPFDGDDVSAAWVAPVTRADGSSAVLKVGMPHMESRDEIAGLRFWNGSPTVQILEAEDDLEAMLLERCNPGTPLRRVPEPEQDRILAGLFRRLWRPERAERVEGPRPERAQRVEGFRPLSEMLRQWSIETMAQMERWVDPGLVHQGLLLFDQLPRSAPEEMLLATDLHAGNVLSAEREPWLVIDPKPFVGDPAYDATQHLLNCPQRLRADPQGTIDRFADLLGLDRERVRLWTFARLAAEPRDQWQDDWRMDIARRFAR
jgi:streptomycin 6-kinase